MVTAFPQTCKRAVMIGRSFNRAVPAIPGIFDELVHVPGWNLARDGARRDR
jgi:hypothetical protein